MKGKQNKQKATTPETKSQEHLFVLPTKPRPLCQRWHGCRIPGALSSHCVFSLLTGFFECKHFKCSWQNHNHHMPCWCLFWPLWPNTSQEASEGTKDLSGLNSLRCQLHHSWLYRAAVTSQLCGPRHRWVGLPISSDQKQSKENANTQAFFFRSVQAHSAGDDGSHTSGVLPFLVEHPWRCPHTERYVP